MLNRRRFTYTLMGLIALGSGRWTATATAMPARVSLEGPLTREVFLSLLKDPFSLLLDNRAKELVLVSVEDDESRPDSEQFTPLFEGSRDLVLAEGMYRISHATAGTTQVFLQSAGQHGLHQYYKASFNLLR
jgi:hypothetical protein